MDILQFAITVKEPVHLVMLSVLIINFKDFKESEINKSIENLNYFEQ